MLLLFMDMYMLCTHAHKCGHVPFDPITTTFTTTLIIFTVIQSMGSCLILSLFYSCRSSKDTMSSSPDVTRESRFSITSCIRKYGKRQHAACQKNQYGHIKMSKIVEGLERPEKAKRSSHTLRRPRYPLYAHALRFRGESRGGSLGSNEPPFLLVYLTYWFFVTPNSV